MALDDFDTAAIKRAEYRAFDWIAPRPRITIPDMRQNMDWGGIRPAINRRDPAKQIILVGFGVFNEHVKIAIFGECLRNNIDEFDLRVEARGLPVAFHQISIG